MEDFTKEELLEMIGEMDEGDLMQACDEVGVDWSNLSGEAELRAALCEHYGVATGHEEEEQGNGVVEADRSDTVVVDANDDDDDDEWQEQRELVDMMDYDDALVALEEEGVEILEDTLEWMQCALLAHLSGRPIPGPSAKWDSDSQPAGVARFDIEADTNGSAVQPEGSVIYSGFLHKFMSGTFHSRRKPKRLHFELMSNSLVYYEQPGGKPLREIDLRTTVDIRAKPSVSEKDHNVDACAFQLVTPLRTWELRAEEPDQANEWIRVLKKQLKVISDSIAADANLDLDDDDLVESAFETFERYATPGKDGDDVLTIEGVEDLIRAEVGFAVNQEYVDAVCVKFDRKGEGIIDLDEFLEIYKFMYLAHVAHLAAFEQGDVGDDEDERENASKVGSKDWLKAKKRHVIKKSQEEGFQDKLIRGIASLIAVIIMLVLLYGAIGLLSGDGVEQYPCETIQPCHNGAECSNSNPYGNNSYFCDCIDGWAGVNCESDYNECLDVPCLNGGLCADERNSYDCQCPRGFKGRNCDVDVNECDSSPCVRGVCGDLDARYHCMCPPGFNGSECQLDKDECQSNPCQTGRCHDGYDRYTCVCDAGFSGRECEVDTDECASRPCFNHGNCSAQPARDAATEAIRQRSIPLGNVNLSNARLHELSNLLRFAGVPRAAWDTSDSYTCSCAAGYSGSTCHEDVDECASGPCIHGFCTDQRTSYRCSCERDWYGENCDIASAFSYWYEFEAPSNQLPEDVVTEMTALLELNATLGERVRDPVITSLYQSAIISRDLVKVTVETFSMQKSILVTTLLASGRQLPAGWKFLGSNFESCDHRRMPRITIDSGDTDDERVVLLREAQANPAGWTNDKVTNVGIAGLVHGPWGDDEINVQITVPVPEGLTMCMVSWRSWMADSRDPGEMDRVYVDGQVVWELAASYLECGAGSHQSGWIDGSTEFPDYPSPWWRQRHGNETKVCYANVEVEVPCTGGGNMDLAFRSGIDQPLSDESWAFSNVTVVARKATTIIDCVVNYGYNLPLQTASGDLAVDLFIAIDLSTSFDDDLDNLASNVGNLHALLGQVSRLTRVGFGGFIDKPNLRNPSIDCYRTFSDIGNMTAESIAATYATMVTDSGDPSATSLSALYAIANRAQLPDTHADHLSFDSSEDTLKIVLVATDAMYKNEMNPERDGVFRARGDLTSNQGCDADGICHDGCDEFAPPDPSAVLPDDMGRYWVYPDASIVRDAIQDARIMPLFAVTADQLSTYQALLQELGGIGFVTSLASDSGNLGDAIVVGLGGILERQQNLTFPAECMPGDECASHPCQNGGICTDDPYSPHQCLCVGDFTGDDCQYEADDCCSYPCDNGADCSDLDAAYVCNCHPGYTGENCAEQVEECTSSPCMNGAACEDVSIDAYRCRCLDGWRGHDCEEDVNECFSMPCRNHGACTDSSEYATVAIDSFDCTCQAGFTGLTCQEDVDECMSSPCLNSANCFDLEDDFWCSCKEGYSGSLCENEADYCESDPCLHNGVCNSLSTNPPTYSCQCAAGYMGSHCHLDIDECAAFEPGVNPGCRNGGECSDSNLDATIPVLEYRCTCLSGFEGTDCETMINPCDKGSETALGHGCDLAVSTCVWSGPSSYACQCNEGYVLQEGSDHQAGWVCEDGFPWILFIGLLLLFCFLCTFFGFYAHQYRRMLKLPLVVGTLELDDKTQEGIDLDIRAMATDSVSALKSQIELASGVLAREQRVFIVKDEQNTIFLEDDNSLGDYGIARHWSAPKKQDLGAFLQNPFEIPFFVLPDKSLLKLQMMQCWQIFVKVRPPANSSEEAVVVVLDVVVPHWRVESVKLKIEDKTGVKSQHQRLSHNNESILDGQRLKDYPAIKNMDTIEMVDATPQEKPKTGKNEHKTEDKKKSRMKADSVLSMAKMFQAGQAPGANLSDLQERAMLEKRKAGEQGATSHKLGASRFENPLGKAMAGDSEDRI